LVSIPEAFYPKIPVFAISPDFSIDLGTIIDASGLRHFPGHSKRQPDRLDSPVKGSQHTVFTPQLQHRRSTVSLMLPARFHRGRYGDARPPQSWLLYVFLFSIYLAMANMWNLLAGYSGLVSLC
jgi:hypothetical protein